MTDDVTRTRLSMVCVCRDEGKQAAYANRSRVGEILELDDRGYQTMSSQIIYAMTFMFKTHWDIETVYADQWMLVSIKCWPDGETITVECDHFEDGLVALFLHLYDNYEREE